MAIHRVWSAWQSVAGFGRQEFLFYLGLIGEDEL